MINLRAEIVQKSGNLWDFWTIFKIFVKLIFALNLKFECLHAQIICTRIFIKFLLHVKKWLWLQNQQKHTLQQKNVVAGKNLPYGQPIRIWIVWTAGWLEPGDKWMMVTILGWWFCGHHPRMTTTIHLSAAPNPRMGPPTT